MLIGGPYSSFFILTPFRSGGKFIQFPLRQDLPQPLLPFALPNGETSDSLIQSRVVIFVHFSGNCEG